MEDQDSEPLFGPDVYSLLRDDSLLHRTGSTNFAALIESAETANTLQHLYENVPVKQEQEKNNLNQESQNLLGDGQAQRTDIKMEVDQSTQNINQQQPQSYFYRMDTNGDLVLIGSDTMPGLTEATVASVPNTEQQEVDCPWDSIDNDAQQVQINTARNNSLMALIEETTSSALPDTTTRTVPSLQPWEGKYNFKISLPTGNKDRNKWCYSQELKKLYVCPNVAVPVNINMSDWVDASITITPVFQQSQHRMESVTRCYNCKSNHSSEPLLADYVVQIEGEGCEYDVFQDRHIVKVPLKPPPPGEESSILLVKLMCLTSCVGGPNRRPFCLVLTVRSNISGLEIGRQILDVKCCKCPSRDLNNDEKASVQDSNISTCTQAAGEEKVTKIRKLTSEIQVRRKKPKIKHEPGLETRFVNIAVPVQFELQVKSYVNGLIAEQIVRRNQPSLLLYPEEET